MGEKVLGIDISVWQDNNSTPQMMDFNKAKAAGARFTFIKASQQLWSDPDIKMNWANAKAAGLLRGAYHFMTWDKPARDQARYHWSIIKDDPGELPPVCDFEWWGTIPSGAYGMLWEYVNELAMLGGRKPMIYTGYYFWLSYGNTSLNWAQFPLWLAWYTTDETIVRIPKPWTKITFWQWTSKGDGLAFGAESLNIDLDYFMGSYDDLKKFAGIVDPPPPPPPPTPDPVSDAEKLRRLWEAHPELHNTNIYLPIVNG